MSIIRGMSEKKGQRIATMVYIHGKVKRRFQRALLDLEDVDFAGRPPDMSNVTAALWHHFAGLSPADAEAFLAREFPRLEQSILAAMAKDRDQDQDRDRETDAGLEAGPDVASHDTSAPPKKKKGRTA